MLTIFRTTPTTDSLVTFVERAFNVVNANEQTTEYNYKPSDLVEIIVTNDTDTFQNSTVSIQMQQKVFTCLVSELDINDSGAGGGWANIAQLRAALQPVFFDTNTGGGGGGTTDNSTPIHFVYKATDGTFSDTNMTYDVGDDSTVDNAVLQARNIQANANDGHLVTHTPNVTQHAFTVAGNFQKFQELKKLNSDIGEDFTYLIGQGAQFIDINKDENLGFPEKFIMIGDTNDLVKPYIRVHEDGQDFQDDSIIISANIVKLRSVNNALYEIDNLLEFANNDSAVAQIGIGRLYKNPPASEGDSAHVCVTY